MMGSPVATIAGDKYQVLNKTGDLELSGHETKKAENYRLPVNQ